MESRTCLRMPAGGLGTINCEARARDGSGAAKEPGLAETAVNGGAPASVVEVGAGWLGADKAQHRSASAWLLECAWFAAGDIDWRSGHGPLSQHSIRASGVAIHAAQFATLPDSNARLANIDAAARSSDTDSRMRPGRDDVNCGRRRRLRSSPPPATEASLCTSRTSR